MNRRNIIRGLVASAVVPALPVVAAPSIEDRKREAMRLLLSLPMPDLTEAYCLTIHMSHIGDNNPRAVEVRKLACELFDTGMPTSEIYQRVTAFYST